MIYSSCYSDKENNHRRYWLGAHKQNDGSYYWIDGRKVDGTYVWAPGEPNNYQNSEECLDLTWFAANTDLHIPEAFALNDDHCDTNYFYICEGNSVLIFNFKCLLPTLIVNFV